MSGKHDVKQSGQRSTTTVSHLMSTDVCSCESQATLNDVAQIMWEHDCGAVPVLDSSNDRHVIGIVTDRDIAMAAYLKGKLLREIPVREVMSTQLATCKANDPIETAEHWMVQAKVRRLPVVDDEGRLTGLLCLAHLALEASHGHNGSGQQLAAQVGQTLSRICEPREVEHTTS